MPRSLPGPVIGASKTRTSPDVGCSKPATMRSSVDLPQPEAPIRQTNSPLPTISSTLCSASMRSLSMTNVLLTSRTWRNGRRSAMVLRAPAQDVIVQRHDQPVAQEPGDADDDHAGDHEVGARQGPAIHDHRAETRGYAGHFANHDQDPGEAVAQAQPGEDARQRGGQDDLAEQAGDVAAQHVGRLEQARIPQTQPEDGLG